MSYDPNNVAAVNQQEWRVDEWDGPWATKTGGETSGEVSKAYDGGELEPEVLGGRAETSNIVLTRPYRPGKHAAIFRAWEKQVLRLRTTVSAYDTDPDLGPIGDPLVYANALLVRCKRVDYDAAGSDAGNIELEFAVKRPA